jgi:D-amino-acid dehydrogenase
VLPLTVPGAVGKAFRSMLRPGSPFYVKPRWSPTFWRWMWNFAQRCNRRDMLAAAAGLHRLLQSSASLYAELIDGQGLQCEWQRLGLLYVYQSPHEFQEYARTNELTREHFGVDARPVEPRELESMEPALKPGLGGAWYFDCDSHLRPDRLMSEMARLLGEHEVAILENRRVSGLVQEQGLARAVATDAGELAARQFVFATGALTPFLNRVLGCEIPIQPGKGYSLTMPRPKICPKYPLIFEQHRVAITPMQSAYRIGSTMEFAGYDRRLNARRLSLLKSAAALYLKEPYADPVLETWYGWRPMTWDSLPFIDRVPAARNVWVAAGHNMLGISTATATGKLVAELVTQTPAHIDHEPYRLSRIRRR